MAYQSRHASSLADLIMRQGDIAADRAQRSGDVWAHVARGLGSIPAGIQQQRAADQEGAQKQRLFDSQMATADLQRRNTQGEMDERARGQKDKDEGRALAKRTEKVVDWLSTVQSVPDPGAQQAEYARGRAALVADGTLEQDDPGIPASFHPPQVKLLLEKLLLPAAERLKRMLPEEKTPEDFTLGPGQQRFAGGGGAPLASVPATVKEPEPPTPGSFEDYLAAPADRQAQIRDARKGYQQADDRPPQGATVVIQTVDAQGNPVSRIVPKTAGAEFAAPQTGAQRQQTAENTAVLTGLTRLKELTSAPKALDAWVGPVQGRVNSAKLVTPGIDVDPTMAEFFAEVAAIKNRMIRAITGAQMSEPEAKRIMAQLPDINLKPEVFRARMAATERNLEALNAAMAAKGSRQADDAQPGDIVYDSNGNLITR